MLICKKCGKNLETDDVGAYRKFINRRSNEFMCRACIAEHFGCDVELINKKIEQFKRSGCMLFAPLEK